MTSAEPTPQPAQPPHELPRREARSLLVHVAVDIAVAFLATVIVLLILDVSIWAAFVVSVILGVVVAPFTRRAEERALARRYAAGPGSPAA